MRQSLAGLFSFLQDSEHRRRSALLAQNPIFEGLPLHTIGRLLPRMFEKQYAPGDVVFHAGDPGRGLFIVLEGEVEIVRHEPGIDEPRRLAVLGDNTAFGELALIDEHPRAATARVTTPTRMLILYRSEFEAMIAGEPRVAVALARNLLRILAGYVRNPGTRPAAAPAGPKAS